MSCKGINCIADQDKFDALNTKIYDWCIANGYTMDQWMLSPIIHPTTGDKGMKTRTDIEPALTSAEQAEIITFGSDWFDDPI